MASMTGVRFKSQRYGRRGFELDARNIGTEPPANMPSREGASKNGGDAQFFKYWTTMIRGLVLAS
jgi:hypothetical protein